MCQDQVYIDSTSRSQEGLPKVKEADSAQSHRKFLTPELN